VTVKGLPLSLDLGVLGAEITPGSKTVAGLETSAWPFCVGVAVLVLVLTLLNVARKLLAVVGVLVTVAAGALLYYCANVVDIETSDRGPIARAIADALVESSTGPGPPLILASGIAILAGALLS
jgi:xanthine/uracil permease